MDWVRSLLLLGSFFSAHCSAARCRKLWQHEIPRDRDMILYCSCPNEVSSARTALLLHRNGIRRVRPLLGGIDAWRERNYPTEPRLVRVASLPGAGQASGERNLFN